MGLSKRGCKRCQVCLNVSEKYIFESFRTKRQYKFNHHINYNDKCLVYLVSCTTSELQHVGSTTDRFRLRWNNYKDNDWIGQRGEEHMQPELFEHFHSEEHNEFLQDCSTTLIDKTDDSDYTKRKRVSVWFSKLWVLMGH